MPMQDARTETKLQEMENEYIAEKNSQPTYQAYAEAEKKKKERERAEAAKAQTAPTTAPSQEPPKKDPDPKS